MYRKGVQPSSTQPGMMTWGCTNGALFLAGLLGLFVLASLGGMPLGALSAEKARLARAGTGRGYSDRFEVAVPQGASCQPRCV